MFLNYFSKKVFYFHPVPIIESTICCKHFSHFSLMKTFSLAASVNTAHTAVSRLGMSFFLWCALKMSLRASIAAPAILDLRLLQ